MKPISLCETIVLHIRNMCLIEILGIVSFVNEELIDCDNHCQVNPHKVGNIDLQEFHSEGK